MPRKPFTKTTKNSHVFNDSEGNSGDLEPVPANLKLIKKPGRDGKKISYVIDKGVERRVQIKYNAVQREVQRTQTSISKKKKSASKKKLPKETNHTKKHSHVFYVIERKLEDPLEFVPANLEIIIEPIGEQSSKNHFFVLYKGEKRRIQTIHSAANCIKSKEKLARQEAIRTKEHSHVFYVKGRNVKDPLEFVPANLDVITEAIKKPGSKNHFFVIYQGEKRRIHTIGNAIGCIKSAKITSKKREKKQVEKEPSFNTPPKMPKLSEMRGSIMFPSSISAEEAWSQRQNLMNQKKKSDDLPKEPLNQPALDPVKSDFNSEPKKNPQDGMAAVDPSCPGLDNSYVPFSLEEWGSGFGFFDKLKNESLKNVEPPLCNKKIIIRNN